MAGMIGGFKSAVGRLAAFATPSKTIRPAERGEALAGTSLQSARGMVRNTLNLIKPYWLSKRGLKGWGYLTGVVGLMALGVVLSVQFSEYNAQFVNHLQKANAATDMAVRAAESAAFWLAFGKNVACVAGMIGASVYGLFLRQKLQLDFRKATTEHTIDKWLGKHAFYRLPAIYANTDNPEQRIQEDIRDFTASTINIPLSITQSVSSMAAFIGVLWSLSAQTQLIIGGHDLTFPGWLMVGAAGYAAAGTAVTHYFGKPLIGLGKAQQKAEADFRAEMGYIREHAESVVSFGGEGAMKKSLRARFNTVADNWLEVIKKSKKLGWIQSYYGEASDLLPFVICAPAVLMGGMSYGRMVQARIAFSRVDRGLSWFVNSYQSVADWRATTERLTSFDEAIDLSNNDVAHNNFEFMAPDDPAQDDRPPVDMPVHIIAASGTITQRGLTL